MISFDCHDKPGRGALLVLLVLDKDTGFRVARSLAQCQPTIKRQSQDWIWDCLASKPVLFTTGQHCRLGGRVTGKGGCSKLLQKQKTPKVNFIIRRA